MAKQATLTIFPEIEDIAQDLTDEQFGVLMRSVMGYRFRGEGYSGSDPLVKFAFRYMANQVDRGEEARSVRSKAAKGRWEGECKPMQSDASGCKVMQVDANECKPMQSDAPIQSIPIQSNPIQSIPVHKESKADEPPAPTRRAKKSFGEFGWVKLTDEEYHRLVNDLGEAEVKRCIAYIDESAQSTGNKNKWRDWNLVIRKCSREGWGLNRYGKQKVAANKPFEPGEAEMEAIRRVLAEYPD